MNSSPTPEGPHLSRVLAVKANLVTIDATMAPVRKNEVIYIRQGDRRLEAEVLRVQHGEADAQVYESTDGVRVGDPVELSGELLSATLGPGLLGQIYDGLQNPLPAVAQRFGFFLPRGVQMDALDVNRLWAFTPVVRVGDALRPGGRLGHVQEGRFAHHILVPAHLTAPLAVLWLHKGNAGGSDVVARLRDGGGRVHEVMLQQRWPVRRSFSRPFELAGSSQRLYPTEPVLTTIRLIDTFFPIARGGTACIPGPFGAGKTVLQQLIARYSAVDVVIIVACGERAGEVVETITEFPELKDPKTGGPLMDRTVIICNTSAMPVAARESSVYLGVTIGEYYRQMGYDVLVLADSTSRWAQAMREISGRMEEIPGEEAFPAYLDSAIKSLYERAGVIRVGGDESGSLTLIGTVSPAGGNFEEPVTQATLGTVKTFLGLSSDRAYRRFYPAVDPLISWSRYFDQLEPWLRENLDNQWRDDVERMKDLLRRGDDISQMMQVTGEEGISIEDFETYQKALLVDMVYLQQDAFDPQDVSTPLERQHASLQLLRTIVERAYHFADKDSARRFFTELTALYRNLNYSVWKSAEYHRLHERIEERIRSGPPASGAAPYFRSSSPSER